MSSNPAHGEVYPIPHYVIKIVRLVVCSGYSVSSTNKTDRQDIAVILLKVALNTINLTHNHIICNIFFRIKLLPFLILTLLDYCRNVAM
jgi:hypothetical protein